MSGVLLDWRLGSRGALRQTIGTFFYKLEQHQEAARACKPYPYLLFCKGTQTKVQPGHIRSTAESEGCAPKPE